MLLVVPVHQKFEAHPQHALPRSPCHCDPGTSCRHISCDCFSVTNPSRETQPKLSRLCTVLFVSSCVAGATQPIRED